jgi:hypothetical protein
MLHFKKYARLDAVVDAVHSYHNQKIITDTQNLYVHKDDWIVLEQDGTYHTVNDKEFTRDYEEVE